MNLVNICPDIPDAWRGGSTAVCKILGGISRRTVDKYAALGRRGGGIDWKPGRRGRIFSGREVRQLWHILQFGK